MSSHPHPPAKTAEVLAILKKRAHDMRTVTYGEIGKETGLFPPGVGRQVGYIRDNVCRARGLPWLNVIVVNQDSRRPGDNFLPEDWPSDELQEHWWRGMVSQVYAYDWSNVELEE